MEENKREDRRSKELVEKDGNLALRKLLELTIDHAYISYDNFVSGKSLAELMKHSNGSGRIAPDWVTDDGPQEPAVTPRKTIRLSRGLSMDEASEDGGHGYFRMRRRSMASDSDNESDSVDEPSRDEDKYSGKTPPGKKKGFFDTLKEKKAQRSSQRLSGIFSKGKPGNASESGDESVWQSEETQESASDAETIGTPKTLRNRFATMTSPRRGSRRIQSGEMSMSSNLQYFEGLLNKTKLHELILVEMIVCLDGSPSQFQVKLAGKSHGKNFLIERMGVCPEFVKAVSGEQLLTRNLLFCLDAMNAPVDNYAREKILSIDHKAFKRWFSTLEKHSLCLRGGLAREVEVTRLRLREILETKPNLTLLEILGALHPQYQRHYLKAFEHPNPIDRYHALEVGSALINVLIDPLKQYEDYKNAFEEQKAILKARRDLIRGNSKTIEQLISSQAKEEVINGISAESRVGNDNLSIAVSDYLTEAKFMPEKLDLSYLDLTELDLSNFLSRCGHKLTFLNLSYCQGITGDNLSGISGLMELRELNLRGLPINAVRFSSGVSSLDLSETKIDDGIFSLLSEQCKELRSLRLCNTSITRIIVKVNIVDLDLTGCPVRETIFNEVKHCCPQIKVLRVDSNEIRMVNAADVSFLTELDVSNCQSLMEIGSVVIEPPKKLSSKRVSYEQESQLRIVRANNCPRLLIIALDEDHAQGLTALYANNNPELTRISLALGLPLSVFSVLEIERNQRLQILQVNPVKVAHFSARYSHNIKTILNVALRRSLINQLVRAMNGADGSLMTVLARGTPNFADWAVKEAGENVFNILHAGGFDASYANLRGADFSFTDLSGADFSGADLSACHFNKSNLSGVSFGQLPMYRDHYAPVTALAQNAEGALVASADYAGNLCLRDNSKILHNFSLNRTISALAFSPDGKKLAVAADRAQGVGRAQVGHRDLSTMLRSIDPHNREKAEELRGFLIFIYDIDPQSESVYQLVSQSQSHIAEVSALTYTIDGKYLISGSAQGEIKVTDCKTGKLHKHLSQHGQADVCALSMHPNNLLLAAGYKDGSIIIWNPKVGNLVETLGAQDKTLPSQSQRRKSDGVPEVVGVNCLAWSPDGKFLVTGSADRTVKIWHRSRTKWECDKTLLAHREGVQCVAIDPGSRWVYSADAGPVNGGYSLIVWDIITGEMVRRFGCETGIQAMIIGHTPVIRDDKTYWVVRTGSLDYVVRRYVIPAGGPSYQLERTDMSTALNVTGLRITRPIGLSEENQILLEQLGVEVLSTPKLTENKAFKLGTIFTDGQRSGEDELSQADTSDAEPSEDGVNYAQ